jgi:hypothetical protein
MSNNDTISTDPRMQAEARKAATEATLPRLPYDPKAVAREEFERVVDKKYCDQTFEQVWEVLTFAHEKVSPDSPILGAMTEAEYRQFAASLFHHTNAIYMEKTVLSLKERSSVLYKAAMYSVRDRLKLDGKTIGAPDMKNGMFQTHEAAKVGGRTCILHPNGCPEGSSSVRELLESLLGRKS